CTFLPLFRTTNLVEPEAGLVGETFSVRSVIVTVTDAAAARWAGAAFATAGSPSRHAATAATSPPRNAFLRCPAGRSVMSFLLRDAWADVTRRAKGVSTENAPDLNRRVTLLLTPTRHRLRGAAAGRGAARGGTPLKP